MSTLNDLNIHLFNQLDRLAKAEPDQLDNEVKRSIAVVDVSEKIIDAHNTQLQAVKLVAEYKGLHPDQRTPQLDVNDVKV